jgi:hypothetical protein
MDSAANPPQARVGIDIRPAAYTSLGQLIVALNDPNAGIVYGAQDLPGVILVESEPTDEEPKPSLRIERRKTGIIYEKLGDIFGLVRLGLKRKSRSGASSKAIGADTKSSALNCSADLVEALGKTADPYISGLINDILDSGLSEDLIHCLHSIAVCVPAQQVSSGWRSLAACVKIIRTNSDTLVETPLGCYRRSPAARGISVLGWYPGGSCHL